MMRLSKYSAYLGLALMLAAACSEKNEAEQQTQPIAFSLGNKQIETKLGTTMETIKSDNVYIYGYKGGSVINSNYSNGGALTYSSQYNNWYPRGVQNWATWDTSGSYEFYARADNKPSSGLTVTSATNITVTEPSTYNESSMIDYLLSYRFTCNGSAQPLVQIELEHALARVDIYVIRDKSVKSTYVTELTCENFYRAASMECSTHQLYDENDQQYNVWKTTLSGSGDTKYTKTGTFSSSSKTGSMEAIIVDDTHDKYSTPAYMSFLTVPQTLTKDATRISLKYYVNEAASSAADNYVLHEDDYFDLVDENLPEEWLGAHRYIYIVKINTGVDIQGYVVDWVTKDYIEGTVLPDIED